MVNWSEYLESVRQTYAQWWKVYTFTDVVGHRQVEQEAPLWNFDLQVQTIKPRDEQREQQEKIEQYSVLEGLRKYKSDHVLLVGKPGSGKSTALLRLLLEEAEREELAPHSLALKGVGGLGQIPVLVELRYYQTSIIDLIRNFCKRHRLLFKNAEIEELLFQGQFLLLVDGLNELPSEEARRNLQAFRQDYRQTPMIFTTRDLGIGGDLDISKKLEMQPLTETQMQEFVCAYLPEQGEEMLKQLGTRLQEFGQTPLLLWMLCSVFVQNQNKVPSNLGSVFRLFTQSYNEKLKRDIPVSVEFRRWSSRLLQQLAWVMTKGTTRTDLNVAIPRSEAEELLTKFLNEEKFDRPRDRSLELLQDLLNHHLIQLGANDQIEFRHQLIQEYYTAEYLLKLLPKLSDDCLKRDYLNYLKWTEPLSLMAELIENEAQAVRVVKLALEVDWQLGARLAGEVKSEWQEQTVNLIADLKLPQLLEIRLFGITKSSQAIRVLIKFLEHPESDIRNTTISLLEKIKSEEAIPGLIKLLEHPEAYVRGRAAYALEKIKSPQAISGLIKTLKHPKSDARTIAVSALLGKTKSSQVISDLIGTRKYPKHDLRSRSADTLGRIKSAQVVNGLIELLEDPDYSVRTNAIYSLGKIKSARIVSKLIKLLEDPESYVRLSAASALGKIKSEQAIPGLIKLLEDPKYYVCGIAASALGKIKSEQAITGLIKLLKYPEFYVRSSAASALGEIKSEKIVIDLIKILNTDEFVIANNGDTFNHAIQVIETIQEHYKFYNPLLKNMSLRSQLIDFLLNSSILNTERDRQTLLLYFGYDSLIKKITLAGTPQQFTVNLIQVLELEGRDTLLNFIDNLAKSDFLGIENKEKLTRLSADIRAITAENWRNEFIGAQLQLKSETISIIKQNISTTLMNILHLSDLHFSNSQQAQIWSNQLAEDLHNDLKIPHLDVLILSGDIANFSTPEEYQAAEEFIVKFCQDFPLKPEQIIIVPGNHDLNWKMAKQAYQLFDRDEYEGQLKEGHYIQESTSVIRVRDEEKYKQRFVNFSNFYQAIKNQPYPLEYRQQYTLDHLPSQNILILGLNSAWQLDHHYKSRASINMDALSNALTDIRRHPEYKNCMKIAVWHHPLDSAWDDRIKDKGFMEQLAVAGFRLFLHGHIHKAETSLYRYDMSKEGRKCDRICAGTFGAPTKELIPAYPWQYNLLQFESDKLTVRTRRREEENGAWKPDARWGQGAGKSSLDSYSIEL
ncbi:hypothetical protein NIES4074_06370 [Cylindrospermum sp. NIES-4074]|nr:hypothetical protein NIES4074_06370 [Cylindrospermum sp. NIES-4074]